MKKETFIYILTALLVGVLGAFLSVYGNPINTGICISCFMENFTGAIKLHQNIFMQYIRPELLFISIGSFAAALCRKEFKARISGSVLHSFLGGIFMIVGSAVFIGCPIKMMLKLSGGDLNSIAGIIGTIFGVWLGVRFLKTNIDTSFFKVTDLKSSKNALLIPLSIIFLTVLYFLKPEIFSESQSGAGAEKTPLMFAVTAGLLLGVFSQYSRFCITGSIRNSLILKNPVGFLALFILTVSALVVNLYFNRFNAGLIGQPGSHTAYLWSFLSMTLVGYIAVLIDGCPFRQIIKMGEGDINAQVAFIGMIFGAAMVQNFSILSDSGGPTLFGKAGVVAGITIFAFLSYELIKDEKN